MFIICLGWWGQNNAKSWIVCPDFLQFGCEKHNCEERTFQNKDKFVQGKKSLNGSVTSEQAIDIILM